MSNPHSDFPAAGAHSQCAKCFKPMGAAMRYCPHCGALQTRSSQPDAVAARRKVWGSALAAVALSVLAGAAAAQVRQAAAAQAAEQAASAAAGLQAQREAQAQAEAAESARVARAAQLQAARKALDAHIEAEEALARAARPPVPKR